MTGPAVDVTARAPGRKRAAPAQVLHGGDDGNRTHDPCLQSSRGVVLMGRFGLIAHVRSSRRTVSSRSRRCGSSWTVGLSGAVDVGAVVDA